MAKPTLFKDIGKTPKDLLEKDFPTDSWCVEVEAKADDSKYKVTATQKAGNFNCVFEPTFNFPHGVTAKTTMKNEQSFAAEVTSEDKLVKGAKVTLSVEQGKNQSVKLATDYKHALGAVTASVTYPVKGDGKIIATAGLTQNFADKYTVGASAEHTVGGKLLSQWNLRFQYATSKLTLLGYYNFKAAKLGKSDSESADDSIVGINYYHKVRDDLELVTDISVDTHKTAEPKFRVGGVWKRTDKSNFKFKLDTEKTNRLTLSHSQKLSSDATLVVGFGNDLTPTLAPTKYGATLKFNF